MSSLLLFKDIKETEEERWEKKKETERKERKKGKRKTVQSNQCVSRGKLGIDLSFD